MKKTVALLMALVLMLTAVCPAFALSSGETLKLAVLGDSISYGTGLYAGEKAYRTLVAEYFLGETPLNLTWDGNECGDVLRSITRNPTRLKAANCYAMSVGSNDYLEYLADYILEVSEPGVDFMVGEMYSDLTDFFVNVLTAPASDMRDGILRFLHADQASRTDWKNDFCDTLKANLTEIISALHGYNQEAPILLLNYYSPGDPYADFANRASTLLNAANRNIQEAIRLMDRARTVPLEQCAILLPMIQMKLVKLAADIHLFVPLLKQFDLNLTMLSPLLALAGVGFVRLESFSRDRGILDKLDQITELAMAVNQLIQFTSEVLTQMNGVLKDLTKSDPLLVIIDVAEMGKSAEAISPVDHFHPSASGQQIIADKMIAALETIYAGGEVTPPAPERTDWLTETIAFFQEWLDRIFQ